MPEELRKLELKTPKGTRDFGPEQMAVREKVIGIISNVFKRHGAVSIDTPVFELKEILTGKYGDEGAKLIYDLADQGGELCSLRYDLTVPFARYLAANKIERMKRYHIAKVYRRDQPVMTKGRYREFYQCDFDIAGPGDAMVQEAECLKVVHEVLTSLGIDNFEIRVNHRLLLEGMFTKSGLPANSFKTACASVDKLDKQVWAEVREELIRDKVLDASAIDKLGELVLLRDKNANLSNVDLLHLMSSKFLTDGESACSSSILKALDELQVLVDYAEMLGFSKQLVFYPSLARGLDYYTGIIYEVVMKDLVFGAPTNLRALSPDDQKSAPPESTGNLGSVAAGGRYDKLVGMFMTHGKGRSKDIPCVGLSFGIERLFTIMEMKRNSSEQHKVLHGLGRHGQDGVSAEQRQQNQNALMKEKLRVCSMLWEAGIRAEMSYKSNAKLLEQIQSCEKNMIPWMVLFGADEIEHGTVKVRNIVTREEKIVPFGEMVRTLVEVGVAQHSQI